MASPHASSFICLPFSSEDRVTDAYEIYYYVCLGSAAVGAPGALLFLLQVLCGEARKTISKSQKNILTNLAIADFMADLGVFARSIYYLTYWKRHGYHNNTNFENYLVPAVGGVFIESWVTFWYLASYFWTFFFAVDIYSSKHKGSWKLWCSHVVTWVYCVILATAGFIALWACKPFFECTTDKNCVVSHFLCTFGPIIVFMLALPLFYGSTLKKMEKTFREGLVIEVRKRERQQAKKKVFVFILVFYICWLVNVLDGVLLIVAHMLYPDRSSRLYHNLYRPHYIYSVWILEALLNPLQGLLNALAYGNTCQGLVNCYRAMKRKMEASSRFNSWSGEYIDVDFREGTRGSIVTARRKFTRSQ